MNENRGSTYNTVYSRQVTLTVGALERTPDREELKMKESTREQRRLTFEDGEGRGFGV